MSLIPVSAQHKCFCKRFSSFHLSLHSLHYRKAGSFEAWKDGCQLFALLSEMWNIETTWSKFWLRYEVNITDECLIFHPGNSWIKAGVKLVHGKLLSDVVPIIQYHESLKKNSRLAQYTTLVNMKKTEFPFISRLGYSLLNGFQEKKRKSIKFSSPLSLHTHFPSRLKWFTIFQHPTRRTLTHLMLQLHAKAARELWKIFVIF